MSVDGGEIMALISSASTFECNCGKMSQLLYFATIDAYNNAVDFFLNLSLSGLGKHIIDIK
jgi:hypothetical protein